IIVATTDPANLSALRDGHLALQQGRLEQGRNYEAAASSYERAARAFAKIGSPLQSGAMIGIAISDSFLHPGAERTRGMLLRAAGRPEYTGIAMRMASNSANALFYESRHDALAQYDIALDLARRTGDRENMANFHTRKAGILRAMGNKDAAWREALQALQLEASVTEVRSRHHLLGETASVALQHGFPAIAILYQNKAIRLLQEALKRDTQKEERDILQNHLATAFRLHAQIQLDLGYQDEAQKELSHAISLTGNGNATDPIIRDALLARIHQIEGQNALQSQEPERAVAVFTKALERLFPGEYRSFRAMLFAERADAYIRLGKHEQAEHDLGIAIEHIRAEEQLLLEQRKRGEGERLWAGYFSRPREVYERLIRILVERGRSREAFAYAEKARAFEPLTLAMDLDVVPEVIARWTRRGSTLPLEVIQQALPEDTVVIEYYLLPDRLYAWVIARDQFELVTSPLPRKVVDDWSNAVHAHARERNVKGMQATLEQAFEALAAAPLAKIRSRARRGNPLKLVFVPDRSIYGLPLAALRDRAASRYLIEDYSVSVAASAAFYVFSLIRDRELAATGAHTILLVADPEFDKNLAIARGLDRLQWAGREVSRIHSLYGSAIVRAGAEATADEFLALTHNSAIVHFAGHSVANPEAPFRSFLLFAPSANHSGVLDAQELLTRVAPGSTRLCVLAACSSAGGVPIGSEGLAPLVRPLIAAGIPAVVGTLWDINDAPSEELFVAFHRHYRNGRDAADALRAAQLEMMNNENATLSSVLAWAPVQLVGHASSPFRQPPTTQEK
ncbi:MAG TPA: CHAT domain-containing protein, partial [Thermoanaerobaculia bacterium]